MSILDFIGDKHVTTHYLGDDCSGGHKDELIIDKDNGNVLLCTGCYVEEHKAIEETAPWCAIFGCECVCAA